MTRTQFNPIWTILATAVIMAVAVSGCSTGISHFERRYSASNYFEQSQILDDHQYYLFGHPHSPDAVVGIRNGWKFETSSWTRFEPDPATIRDLVDRMNNIPGAERNIEPNGAYILNDQGENIGVWYSVWVLPILRINGGQSFTISDPVPTFPHSNRDPEDGFLIHFPQ